MGQVGVSRRALLTRAGIGTGAGVVRRARGDRSAGVRRCVHLRSRERAHRVRRQAHLPSTGYTSWVNTPKAVDSSDTADLIRATSAARSRRTTACWRRCSTARRRSTTTTPTRSRRAHCARSTARRELRARPREDAARHRHRRRRDDRRSRMSPSRSAQIVASDGQHFSALSVLNGASPVPGQRAARARVEDGGNQLSQFLSN